MKKLPYRIALVTAPSQKIARELVRSALKKRLAACGNIVPAVESIYWWQGKIESSREVLILFKTLKSKLKTLEELIVSEHPYDTPEFVVLTIEDGNARYLSWLSESVSPRDS